MPCRNRKGVEGRWRLEGEGGGEREREREIRRTTREKGMDDRTAGGADCRSTEGSCINREAKTMGRNKMVMIMIMIRRDIGE